MLQKRTPPKGLSSVENQAATSIMVSNIGHENIRIDTDLLIPGRGSTLKDASCVLDGGIIAYVGLRSDLPDEYMSLPIIHVPALLPGLWDAHTHYYGARRLSIDAFYTTPPAVAGARAAHDLTATLNVGFTSVRELGGWGHQVAEVVSEGSIVGPKITAP